jgi:hypothetical protein
MRCWKIRPPNAHGYHANTSNPQKKATIVHSFHHADATALLASIMLLLAAQHEGSGQVGKAEKVEMPPYPGMLLPLS